MCVCVCVCMKYIYIDAYVYIHRPDIGAYLRVCGGGIGDESGGLLAVGAQRADHLGRVRVKVVRDVGERDLCRVQVLESNVHLAQRSLEAVLLVVEDARLVRVEGEALARDELVLRPREPERSASLSLCIYPHRCML